MTDVTVHTIRDLRRKELDRWQRRIVQWAEANYARFDSHDICEVLQIPLRARSVGRRLAQIPELVRVRHTRGARREYVHRRWHTPAARAAADDAHGTAA